VSDWRLEKAEKLERETGFEPATSTLARSHSTTELLPLAVSFYFESPESNKDATKTTFGDEKIPSLRAGP